MKYLSAYLLSLLFSALCLSHGIAQEHSFKRNRDSVITSVRFNLSDTTINIPANEQDFFKTYLEISPEDEFVQVPHTSKREGFIHDRFDQYYKGIRVDEAGYNFHYKDGQMYFANGHYVQVSNLDATPHIGIDKAIDVFLKYKGIGKEDVTDTVTSLLVKEITRTSVKGYSYFGRSCIPHLLDIRPSEQ